jgi:hypothetical protein
MTWIQFATWLFGLYAVYYTCLLGWDYWRNSRSNRSGDPGELTFEEEPQTVQQVVLENAGHGMVSPVVSSGGVSVKQAFSLAREETIDYVKAVSF